MTSDGRGSCWSTTPQLPCSQPCRCGRGRCTASDPSSVDYRQRNGDCYVQDVYAGPGLAGVPRGTIKTLRVVAMEFRAAGIGANGNGGPGGGALISTPVAIGNGAWDPKIILGDAPVHEDGSVFFRVPARTPVYFQVLDENGRMVQTMRSWTTLQPGENASCVGCHEHKNAAPVAEPAADAGLAAGRRRRCGRSTARPRGFSFVREIQPILDRHCMRCHDGRAGRTRRTDRARGRGPAGQAAGGANPTWR